MLLGGTDIVVPIGASPAVVVERIQRVWPKAVVQRNDSDDIVDAGDATVASMRWLFVYRSREDVQAANAAPESNDAYLYVLCHKDRTTIVARHAPSETHAIATGIGMSLVDDFLKHASYASVNLPRSAPTQDAGPSRSDDALPAPVRALLLVEWSVDVNDRSCPNCGCRRTSQRHRTCSGDACEVDTALTGAGLPDQRSRDAARAKMAGEVATLEEAVARLSEGKSVIYRPACVCGAEPGCPTLDHDLDCPKFGGHGPPVIELGWFGGFLVRGTVASGSPFALLTFRQRGGEHQVGIDLDKRILLGSPPVSLGPRKLEEIASRLNVERARRRAHAG